MWTYGDTRKPLLAQTTVTRGTQSWTTTPLYRFGLGNYNDYGRPWHSEEVDQANMYWKRITNQTFQYRLARRTSWIASHPCPSAFGPLTLKPRDRSRVPGCNEPATGFLTSQNLSGLPRTFERSAAGNLAASTDARGNPTTYAYGWGALQDVQTPGTHAAFQVNEDGTTSLATNSVDMPTIFTYDANGRLTLDASADWIQRCRYAVRQRQ